MWKFLTELPQNMEKPVLPIQNWINCVFLTITNQKWQKKDRKLPNCITQNKVSSLRKWNILPSEKINESSNWILFQRIWLFNIREIVLEQELRKTKSLLNL